MAPHATSNSISYAEKQVSGEEEIDDGYLTKEDMCQEEEETDDGYFTKEDRCHEEEEIDDGYFTKEDRCQSEDEVKWMVTDRCQKNKGKG